MRLDRQHRLHDERAATMLEFSLVLTVFLILTFAMIDILRFLAIQTVLTKGAQNGVSMAQEVYGFDADLRPIASPALPAYTAFLNARQRVVQAATSFPLMTFLTPPSPSGQATPGCFACLTGFTMLDDVSRGGSYVRVDQGPYAAGILRPGERALDIGETADNGGVAKYFCHPTLNARNIGSPNPCTVSTPPRPRVSENPNVDPFIEHLKNNPIVVLLRAEMRPMVPWPFFPARWIVYGRAAGFKEVLRLTTVTPDMGIPTMPIIPTTTSTTTTVSPFGGGGS